MRCLNNLRYYPLGQAELELTLKSLLLLLLIGCGNAEKTASIYKAGRIWNYDVSVTDSLGNITDTFSLIMTARESSSAEKIIRPITVCYEYKNGDSLIQKECTGVVDNETSISLHPPREYILEFTEVLPFPAASKQMKKDSWVSYRVEDELHIQKASYFDKGRNETVDLAGKTIKQDLWSSDTITLTYNGESVFCHKIEGKNLTQTKELGEFRCIYFYNEKYGFIKWIYYPPWGDEVVISLRSVVF